MSNKCILIAEDDAAIRRVLADSLAGAGYEVCTAPNGRAALELLLTTPIDLALMDVNMPEINGFQLLRMMQRECPGIPSIILTACGDEQDRVKGLQLGADDYVVKPFSIAELLARVAAVLRRSPGRKLAVAQELHFPGGTLDGESRQARFDNGTPIPLTEKEFELFRYFLTHPGRIIPQEELLVRVWGSTSRAAQTRTVAVTLTRLREKLGVLPSSHIETIRGRGYRWNEA
jgi:DNA-binding response OmpR family regulator